MRDEILEKIGAWSWDAGVLGLGYVGLPLVVTMARAGVDVAGFDVNPEVVEGLRGGRSHVDDVDDEELSEVAERTLFTASIEDLRARDVLFVCVPTPLSIGKRPDTSFVESAANLIAGILRRGHVVVVESTTYPGTTQDLVGPILATSGLRLDEDFLLAYSPERIDPANPVFRTANIPRIVGGASPKSTEAAALVYERFVQKVHRVTDARTAETAKLLENTFRWVNIALVNELASVARGIGVDIWEVIEAASTKPFGYMPFYPGPGVGGHCIPLDPFYLEWAARLTGGSTQFVALAELINARMPHTVVARVQDVLNEHAKPLRNARVLVVGVAYKPNVRDYRESPALDCIRLLRLAGADVSYVDPLVPSIVVNGWTLESRGCTPEVIRDADCVLVLCDHDVIPYEAVAANAPLLVDTRNAFGRRGITGPTITLL